MALSKEMILHTYSTETGAISVLLSSYSRNTFSVLDPRTLELSLAFVCSVVLDSLQVLRLICMSFPNHHSEYNIPITMSSLVVWKDQCESGGDPLRTRCWAR